MTIHRSLFGHVDIPDYSAPRQARVNVSGTRVRRESGRPSGRF